MCYPFSMALSSKLFLLSLVQLLTISCYAQSAVNGGYWFPDSGLTASGIDSTLFTHLFCAFADLDPTTNQVTISPINAPLFSQFTQTVQAKNPSVITLLSLGGGANANIPIDFAAMARQPSSRKSFIDSSIQQARSNGFSGLDLDWEYPQSPDDMNNLGTLLTEWRQAVVAESQDSGNPVLLLTAALYVSPYLDELTYPTESINANLDWVNVMAYDFYQPTWFNFTNSHSMLYDPSGGISGSSGIDEWIESGVDAMKLALGVPFYGYPWRLADANVNGLLAPATSPLIGGGAAMQYNQIRSFIAENNARVVYNGTIVTNYCYSGTTWIGYDDVESISAKVEYAKQRGILGYFAWHVAADDNSALSRQAKQSWGDSEILAFLVE